MAIRSWDTTPSLDWLTLELIFRDRENQNAPASKTLSVISACFFLSTYFQAVFWPLTLQMEGHMTEESRLASHKQKGGTEQKEYAKERKENPAAIQEEAEGTKSD